MSFRALVCGILFAAASAVSTGAQTPAAPDAPTIEVVMARAAAYVQRYEKDFAGIVAEEKYDQASRQGGRFDQFGSIRHDTEKRRVFRSDLLLVLPEGAQAWVQFRDVFEVDGKMVRDRNDRLAKLFLEPNATTAKQIERIKSESARYNVGPIYRNINVPVMALQIVRLENQFRFLYNHDEAEDRARSDGAWAVDFREVGTPTMIRTNNQEGLPMEGRIWIDPQTGRVLSTLMRAQNQTIRGSIQVDYEPEESLGILVPRKMHEEYRVYSDGSGIIADATYSNFRRFQVKVDEQMSPTSAKQDQP